jgi:hypothetical protein
MTTFAITHDVNQDITITEVEADVMSGDTANGITFLRNGSVVAWFEAHRVYFVRKKVENNAPITELNPRQAHAEQVRETTLTAVRDTPPASHDDVLDPPLPMDRITWVRRDHTITELYRDNSYGAMILDVTPFLAGASSEWVDQVDAALSAISVAHRDPNRRDMPWQRRTDELVLTGRGGRDDFFVVVDATELTRGLDEYATEQVARMLDDLAQAHNETGSVPVIADA